MTDVSAPSSTPTSTSSSSTRSSQPPSSSPVSSASPSSPSPSSDFVLITAQPLESYNALQLVGDANAGGVSVFLGTTRSTFEGRRVVRLEYECYHTMAEKELRALCSDMRQMWQLTRIAVLHRTGDVGIGQCSVLIAASSPHRRDCLDAVSWCIDELKRRVPIWKREHYEDGSVWKANSSDIDVPMLSKQVTDVIAAEL